MDNAFRLDAVIASVKPLRYTPQGLPVLELTLTHQSEQIEADQKRKTTLTIEAKIIGKTALAWQNQIGNAVHILGFLHNQKFRHSPPILHIQQIKLLNKG